MEAKIVAQFARVALDIFYGVSQGIKSYEVSKESLISAFLVANGLLQELGSRDTQALDELYEVYREYIQDYK